MLLRAQTASPNLLLPGDKILSPGDHYPATRRTPTELNASRRDTADRMTANSGRYAFGRGGFATNILLGKRTDILLSPQGWGQAHFSQWRRARPAQGIVTGLVLTDGDLIRVSFSSGLLT